MSIIASSYGNTFTVAAVVLVDVDPETGKETRDYQDLIADIRGKLNPYTPSQSTERSIAEQQESLVLYKFHCDPDPAILNQFGVIRRGTRITMNEAPGTVSYVRNSIATDDHIVSVTEEFQEGEKPR